MATDDNPTLPETLVTLTGDRPAILAPFIEDAAAIVFSCGCSDEALLDALFGRVGPEGRLPLGLPSSMDAVEASPSDLPIAGEYACFPAGAGLDPPIA